MTAAGTITSAAFDSCTSHISHIAGNTENSMQLDHCLVYRPHLEIFARSHISFADINVRYHQLVSLVKARTKTSLVKANKSRRWLRGLDSCPARLSFINLSPKDGLDDGNNMIGTIS